LLAFDSAYRGNRYFSTDAAVKHSVGSNECITRGVNSGANGRFRGRDHHATHNL